MKELLCVGDVAKALGVKPTQITALFYERRLREDLCPIVGGRRIVPRALVDVVEMELRRKGIKTRISNEETNSD